MQDNTVLKATWFKNYYLNLESELKILNINPYITYIKNHDFDSIFIEKNWEYDTLSFEKTNSRIVVNEIDKLPIADDYYDVIISYNYLKKNDLTKFLSEIHRILKINGIFCIFIPYFNQINTDEEKIKYEYYLKELNSLIKKEDFKIKHFSDNKLDSSSNRLENCIIMQK